MEEQWVPVGQTRPCPVCGAVKWCLIHRSGRKVICPRTPSNEKYVNNDEVNYVHRISGERAAMLKKLVENAPVIDGKKSNFEKLADSYYRDADASVYLGLVQELGINNSNLGMMNYHVGYDGKAWTMPMKSGTGEIVGIQRRFIDGGKRFVKGSHNGLFVPDGPVCGDLYVCEGFSDTLASYTAGYYSIGRVSAKTGYADVVKFVKANSTMVKRVFIVADNDPPHTRPDGSVYYPGQEGALTMYSILCGFIECWVVIPDGPYVDVREMFNEKETVKYRRYTV